MEKVRAFFLDPLFFIYVLFFYFRAVISWTETELNALLDLVSGIPLDRRKEMLAQGRWIYQSYLSSPQIITMTTFKILSQRLHPHTSGFYEDWNLRPHPVCLINEVNNVYLKVFILKFLGVCQKSIISTIYVTFFRIHCYNIIL